MRRADYEPLEEFIRQLVQRLPPALSNMREELAEHLRAGLEPLLQKMNMVSREEYDIQVVLLERLRKRVAELERQVGEREHQS